MSVLWLLISAPDLAFTEAAVSCGITGVLFFVVLRRIRIIDHDHRLHQLEEQGGGQDASD